MKVIMDEFQPKANREKSVRLHGHPPAQRILRNMETTVLVENPESCLLQPLQAEVQKIS
jgi:hypothetical protein